MIGPPTDALASTEVYWVRARARYWLPDACSPVVST